MTPVVVVTGTLSALLILWAVLALTLDRRDEFACLDIEQTPEEALGWAESLGDPGAGSPPWPAPADVRRDGMGAQGEPATGLQRPGANTVPPHQAAPGPDRAGADMPPVTTAPCAADGVAKGDSTGPGAAGPRRAAGRSPAEITAGPAPHLGECDGGAGSTPAPPPAAPAMCRDCADSYCGRAECRSGECACPCNTWARAGEDVRAAGRDKGGGAHEAAGPAQSARPEPGRLADGDLGALARTIAGHLAASEALLPAWDAVLAVQISRAMDSARLAVTA